ncbi:MAG TPA: hypothetical protein VOA87_19345 [Thermoanaerobaculia bacterium]|nr:hypothetical protein [Thermoanaerobaculia bacterium]
MPTPLRTLRAVLALLATLILSLPAVARAQTAVSVKAGTLGLGVELTHGFTPWLDGRLGVNGFHLSRRSTASGIDYDARADLRTATALLDFRPAGGGFRLTGGLVYDDNSVDGRSRPPASGFYPIGDVQVPVRLLGGLEGRIDFQPLAPYLGLGWSNSLAASGRLGFDFDLGAVFQGKPRVTLTPVIAAGSPLDNPTARALLAVEIGKEEADVEHDLRRHDVYPVVSFGLSYRF